MKQQTLRRLSLLSFAVCVSTATQATEIKITPRIVGGVDAKAEHWPWMVSLQSVTTDTSATPYQKHFCGGSLIADRWILTASHCIYGQSSDELQVRIGAHDIGTDNPQAGHLAKVKRILAHSRYDNVTTNNDIALLELETPSNATKIQPATATEFSQVAIGTALTVAGWGSTSETGEGSKILKQVDVALVSDAACEAARNGTEGSGINENMLCAGPKEGGKDSCYGDSGGPLMVQQSGTWKQLGAVSWGVECGGQNQYGVYAKVPNYIDWFRQHQHHLSQDTQLHTGFLPQNKTIESRFSVYNQSTSHQLITSMTLDAGSTNTGISIANDHCSNKTLSAGSTCDVQLAINATTAGPLTSRITGEAQQRIDLMETTISGYVLVPKTFRHQPDSQKTLAYFSDEKSELSWIDSNETGTLRSGKHELAQQPSALQTLIQGPARIHFEWKLSDELDDKTTLFIDAKKATVSPPTADAWQKVTVDIPTGQHRVSWVMEKGGENPLADRHLLLRKFDIGTGKSAGEEPTPPTQPAPDKPTSDESGGGGIGYWLISILLLLWGRL